MCLTQLHGHEADEELITVRTSPVSLHDVMCAFLHYSWPRCQQSVMNLHVYEPTTGMHTANIRV